MLKKTITYVDYNEKERTEDFYFNFTTAELTEMELSTAGGLQRMIEKLIKEEDGPKIIEIFKELILGAYGEKSPDGKRFIKSDELRTAFSQTEAFSILFMELSTNAEAGALFFGGIVPQNMK